MKASAARGPTAIIIPERGWSDGLELDAEKLRVFVAGLRLWLSPQVTLEIVPDAVGGAAFADAIVLTLRRITEETGPK